MKQPGTKAIWCNASEAPARRLYAFRKWLTWKIGRAFDGQSPVTPLPRVRGQIRELVLAAVRDLNDHGYLLDGDALAGMIDEKLESIAAEWRAGRVTALYPYCRAALANFVRMRAEELKEASLHVGQHISQYPRAYNPSIPELEAERRRETLSAQLQREARREALAKARDTEPTLWDL